MGLNELNIEKKVRNFANFDISVHYRLQVFFTCGFMPYIIFL